MNLPGLPGLTLASAAKSDQGLARTSEALVPSAGGFAEELARRAQGLTRAAAAPERASSSTAGAQGARGPGVSAPTSKIAPPTPAAPDASPAKAASPKATPSRSDGHGGHPVVADAQAHGAATDRSAPGTAQGPDRGTQAAGQDRDDAGPDGAADQGSDADQASDQGAAASAKAPQAAPAPTHQAPPPDAASLAAWVAGWQPPAGGMSTENAVDTGVQQAADAGSAAASGVAGLADAWARARTDARPDAGQRSADRGASALREAIGSTGLDTRGTMANDTRTEAPGPSDTAGSDRPDPTLPTVEAATLPLPGVTTAVPAPAVSPNPAAATPQLGALVAAQGDAGSARLPRELPSGRIERRDSLEGAGSTRGQSAQTTPLAGLASVASVASGEASRFGSAPGADPLRAGQDPDKLPAFLADQPLTPEALPLAADQGSAAQTEARPGSFSQALDIAALASAQGLGSSGATAAAGRGEAPTMALPTPVTDPAFREALGVQVSVLARDGIQSAELHLNPGDMGPISVRIEIDGQNAQVNFGVDHVQTRAIVEAGLPELASALREAGLTLTGGGVSEHGRPAAGSGDREGSSGRPQDAPGDRRGARGEGPVDEPAPPPRRVRLPGAVDLYA